MSENPYSNLVQQLIKHEGIRLKPYRCPAGKLTIGIGRNLDDNGISEIEAYHLCMTDVLCAEADLINNLAYFQKLSKARQEVLINLCFNMGINRLLKFNLFLGALEAGLWSDAARELLNSKYAQQVGKRAIELAEQIKSGKFL